MDIVTTLSLASHPALFRHQGLMTGRTNLTNLLQNLVKASILVLAHKHQYTMLSTSRQNCQIIHFDKLIRISVGASAKRSAYRYFAPTADVSALAGCSAIPINKAKSIILP